MTYDLNKLYAWHALGWRIATIVFMLIAVLTYSQGGTIGALVLIGNAAICAWFSMESKTGKDKKGNVIMPNVLDQKWFSFGSGGEKHGEGEICMPDLSGDIDIGKGCFDNPFAGSARRPRRAL